MIFAGAVLIQIFFAGSALFVMHFHPEYEIYYMFNGERYYFIENKTYHIRKGSLVLVDSMHIHKTRLY